MALTTMDLKREVLKRDAEIARLRAMIPPEDAEVLVPCGCQHPGSLGGDCDGSCMPFAGWVRWMPPPP